MLSKHKNEHKAHVQSAMGELHGELRREISRNTNEHKTKAQKMQELVDEHRSAVERSLAAEQARRDEHRTATATSITELEAQVRKEIARLTTKHQVDDSAMKDLIADQRGAFDKSLSAERAARDEQRVGVLNAIEDWTSTRRCS